MIVDVRKQLGRFHENTVANLVELQKLLTNARPTYTFEDLAERDAVSSVLLIRGDLAYVDDDGTGSPAFYTWDGTSWVAVGGAGSGAARFQYDIGNNITITATRPTIPNATVSAGVITISPPNQVTLLEVYIRGNSEALSPYIDSNGDTTLVVDYQWDDGYNKEFANLLLNSPSVWDFTTYDLDGVARLASPLTHPISFSNPSDNTLSYKIENLGLLEKWKTILK